MAIDVREEARTGTHERTTRYEGRSMFLVMTLGAIWLAVGALSIFTPDLISGTEQEHVPIGAFTGWAHGAIATAFVLLAVAVRSSEPDERRGVWLGYGTGLALLWAAVAVTSIFAPRLVTGSDPTQLPLAALIAPVIGVIVTGFISVLVAGSTARR